MLEALSIFWWLPYHAWYSHFFPWDASVMRHRATGDHFWSHGRVTWYLTLEKWFLSVFKQFSYRAVGSKLTFAILMWLAHIFGFFLGVSRHVLWTSAAVNSVCPARAVPDSRVRTGNFIKHNGQSPQDGNSSARRRCSNRLRKVVESRLVAEPGLRNHDVSEIVRVIRLIRQNPSK